MVPRSTVPRSGDKLPETQKKDNRSLAEFLKRTPAGLKKIEAQLEASHPHETGLRRELKEQGPQRRHITVSGPIRTACQVRRKGTVVRSVGHQETLTPPSKHGVQDRTRGKVYCRLAREVQGFTTMPGRQRRAGGITSGDLIRYTHPVLGAVTGSATVSNSKGKTRAGVSGRRDMKIGTVTLLGRNNGYRYEREPNETPKRN